MRIRNGYPDLELQDSIEVQQATVAFMNMIVNPSIGPNAHCCTDPHTGRSLTFGQFYDLHALMMLVILEAEARIAGTCNDTKRGSHGP